ncbi:DNA binding HTH domain, Psq-type,Homeobox domain-like,HTH CenpB-type DNA-binding domain,DDE superfamily [Cinara cedri]|uniref:DNA binding HTH domain, Psq-type,Homeobox domain-like,HTH CenpB-type DNA-binding domain,DDE superfamily n=1 Tax=Cinara cedri TaxID=506608 RepID=A0A5E4LZC1_9HEMI|nr:DNA binding HTH domain, Psq-type,Homeobox domain-like,HTH CenpB-type DNA-binding domain,DDE superfamily [Cinara cedri]
MPSNRKRVVLSMKKKIDIIAKLEKGETRRALAIKYGVGLSTISDIKKNADSITRYVNNFDSKKGSLSRKTMKKPKIELLEDAVFTWFMQNKASKKPISGPLLCEKALYFNKKLRGDSSFVASTGWLRNFKSRHGIRQREMYRKNSSANIPAAELFSDNIKKYIEKYKFDMDFVYSADEIGLNWKALPLNSSVYQRETALPGYKVNKDRITVMVCANAAGTHKIPLLLIGKTKNPRCFQNVKIPLMYKSQPNSWMNADLFVEWFKHTFIPEVKKFQQNIGKEGKVLLLLDNTPSHPSLETLNTINDEFEVKFFPSNVTSVQPMDQNVIETFKRLYRKEFICRLILDDINDEEIFLSVYRKMNLKDCCYMLVEAWDCVQKYTLESSWDKLLNRTEDTQNEEFNIEIAEIHECIGQVYVLRDCEEEDINEWLLMDTIDPGYHVLSDNEIVRSVNKEGDTEEDDTEEDDTEEEEYETDDDSTDCEYESSHFEALSGLDFAFKWFERQRESNPTELLQLRKLRDLAALKHSLYKEPK